jgi:chromosome segregation ATPase
MTDMRPDAPRYLHDRDTPAPETKAAVDVTELLARLAQRTEELAEAKAQQKHADSELRKRKREVTSERKAHNEARQLLKMDCQALESDCDRLAEGARALELEVAQVRDGRNAVEADLKRVQDLTAALQQKLKIARAELRQIETEAAEQLPWWKRLGS